MESNERIEKALENHKKGYNCSQSIVCAYCDLFGVDEETAFRMSEGFGGGMGGMQDTCGAVTGMFMLAGLKGSGGHTLCGKTKAETYKTIRMLANQFKEMNSTIICRELLGTAGQPKKRSCQGCIEDASRLVEQYLLEQEDKK